MDHDLLTFAVIGFAAQMVDGALGMAYGVISTTFLLSVGIPPPMASAAVHAAEVFTSIASGLSHLVAGNVDRRLLARIVLPGAAGAALGALLVARAPLGLVKPVVAAYLAVMGGVIVWKGLRNRRDGRVAMGRVVWLGLGGGFFDAVGGGGWGAVVTSTFIARGTEPRLAVGTVSLAEFFVACAASAAFIATIGVGYWRIIVGLLAGGVVAAPLAALVCRRLPARALMLLVGALVFGLSLRQIVLLFR